MGHVSAMESNADIPALLKDDNVVRQGNGDALILGNSKNGALKFMKQRRLGLVSFDEVFEEKGLVQPILWDRKGGV
jgi:hypothetical protein